MIAVKEHHHLRHTIWGDRVLPNLEWGFWNRPFKLIKNASWVLWNSCKSPNDAIK